MKKFKILVLVAANGAGKGTFGKFLAQLDSRFLHIDAGNIVRSEIKQQTEIGKKIQPIYESCKYLDESIDEIIWHELIRGKLTRALEQNKTVILDGCLRSNTTFNLLDAFIKINNLIADTWLVQLIASDATCLERILARRICPKCAANYNIFALRKNISKCETRDKLKMRDACEKRETCKICEIGLEIRKSDTQEFTQERLQHFHEHIEPILDSAKKIYEFVAINTECELRELEKKYTQIFCMQNIL